MPSAIRALLASVLCTGLGLAVPCANASIGEATLTSPAHARELTVICCPRTGRRALSVSTCAPSIDTPEFVVPAAFVAPPRPLTAGMRTFDAPKSETQATRVLDLAPKTSPPLAS